MDNLATNKNITMKHFNGTDYDTLYPKTVYNQVSGVAPDGYGLGGIGAKVTDLNDAQKSGFYSAIGAANLPPNVESAQYGSVLVLCSQNDRVTQVYFQDITGGTGAIAVRRLNGNGWSAWEFINPPMKLGIEYRTTERYQEKPVYVRLISCGNMPSAGGSKAVQAPYDGTNNPITNAWIVHSHLSYYNQTLPMYGYGNTVTVKAAAGVNSSGSITIYASEDTDLTNSSAILYVVLKYTKSTD